MPLYNLVALPVPPGFYSARPVKINSHGVIAGTCQLYAGHNSAMIWEAGTPTVVSPPGVWCHAKSINSNGIVVGNYTDMHVTHNPFYWDKNVGLFTNIKFPAQSDHNVNGIVEDINDNNEMTGYLYQHFGSPRRTFVFWPQLNSNPVTIGNPNSDAIGTQINNNGVIAGSITSQGFYRDPATQVLNLIPGCTFCGELNDLTNPQIICYNSLGGISNFMYDTLTGTTVHFSTTGNNCAGIGINNKGEIVGVDHNTGAVIWKGFVKANLNHPLITDAQVKGWELLDAISINDKGYIVGLGMFSGKESPFLLVPKSTSFIHFLKKIPVEHLFPHILWPGQEYDKPKPIGWPEDFPFPIPKPSPFELSGQAFRISDEILNLSSAIEMINNSMDKKEAGLIRKMIMKSSRKKSQELIKLIKSSLSTRTKT